MGKTFALLTIAAMACLPAQVDSKTPSSVATQSVPGTPADASPRSLEQPWLDPKLPPDARARAAVAAMTLDEKLRLVFGYSDQAVTEVQKVPDDVVPPELKDYVVSRAVKGSAGFVPGVARLGIPDQTQTDAS
ncbi:MAG: hypothetical protein ABIW18_06120, partial [Sphingomicrobium sp.]